MKYVDEMPKLNAVSVFADGERSEVLEQLFCTKSNAWKYELERRCIHSEVGTLYTYPAEALTGVYFGPNMPRDVLEIICLVLQGQNPNVRFWQGERSASTFKVEFHDFCYCSHLEAKNSGKPT